jgi:hypothetical protein
MKKMFFLIITCSLLSFFAGAQGNGNDNSQGKNKSKNKVKNNSNNANNNNDQGPDKEKMKKHEVSVWEGTYAKGGSGPKPSKNQPAKVRAAFQRDYPNARNVTWSKYRGDWTATFSGGIFASTAVYHANGDRRDTRTPILRKSLPQVILDDIFKKRPKAELGDIIRIDVPKALKEVFRIKAVDNGTTNYLYYNADGVVVDYDY